MTTTTYPYRILNAGYKKIRNADNETDAARIARTMVEATGLPSIVVNRDGIRIGGCEEDPQLGAPVSYWF